MGRKGTGELRNIKKFFVYFLCMMLCLTGCATQSQKAKEYEKHKTEVTAIQKETNNEKKDVHKKKTESQNGEKLFVDFIDVGQGDATLVRCGKDTMMIDFGNNDKGTAIQKYLQESGVSELTYALGTHPDADHIGGMDVILYKFPTKHVWMPNLTSDTETYRDVLDVCRERGYTVEQPVWQQEYPLGGAKIKILGPVNGKTEYEDKNDASIVVKVTYGESRFLFCGDASQEVENEMLSTGEDVSADVLKLGHHGSSTATGESFLTAVNPSSAIISCGRGNSYGHPHMETMQKLQQYNIALYRTDLQGSIQAVSDGKHITFQQKATTDYRCGNVSNQNESASGVEQASEVASSSEVSYVLNKNTMKFHRPDCRSVNQMNGNNREDTGATRDELMAQGYSACKRCNP